MRAACGCSVEDVATRSTGVIIVAAILCAGALTAAHAVAGEEASSSSDVASPVVIGEVRLSELWATDLGVPGANVAEALLADLNGDGVRDAIVTMGKGRESSTVVALELEEGVEIWRADHAGAVDVLAADLLGSPGVEVVTCFACSVLIQSGATGKILVGRGLSGRTRSVGVARTTSGEQLVIVTVRGDESDRMVALGLPGLVERWRRTAPHDGGVFGDGLSKLKCADIDGDGASEILVVENANVLRCISSSGDDLWSLTLGEKGRLNPEGVASNLPVVADLTGDGYNEVAIGCFAGALVVMDGATGDELVRMRFGNESHREVLASKRLPRFIRDAIAGTGEPIGEMASVDVDGSAGCELVFGCSDGLLYTAEPKWERRVWELDLGGDVYDAPVPVVLKNAGSGGAVVSCLVAWHERGAHVLKRGTGEEIIALPDGIGASDVLVIDVNGDGGDDLIVTSARTQSIKALEFRAAAGGVVDDAVADDGAAAGGNER